jgi:stage V sporulation protein G
MIQTRVIAEYRDELERAKEPGYATRYDDDYGDEDFDVDILPESGQRATTKQIQPAESTPPPPHHPAPRQITAPAPKARRDGFGAGVFDE